MATNFTTLQQTGLKPETMSFGAQLLPGGGARFRLWAPGSDSIELLLMNATEDDRRLWMRAYRDGWFEVETQHARAGTRYRFILPDGRSFPDPASRYQPEDVHGPSEVIN